MYDISFFKDKNGKSPVLEYINKLEEKSSNDKRARVKLDKINKSFQLLREKGTTIGAPIIRNLEKNIYKIRVLDSRFFFLREGNTFVMISHFIKNTQKTPEKEKNIARKRWREFYDNISDK
ncbi:type II toxin-antitoxin system RelE/ParE family toxin [Eubacterium multiforme]|uniref:Phage-related protein n=1 Tax=Eubacterium multiforme TaxID=83339 RepID=A0ABT9UWD4_9FIRM|nr:type II toxin-antitoxin system RelE/ParE family toxin [Eubacterium multiforme]MDQ0150610.1 phage-related protein [Eubacterium multiforme]